MGFATIGIGTGNIGIGNIFTLETFARRPVVDENERTLRRHNQLQHQRSRRKKNSASLNESSGRLSARGFFHSPDGHITRSRQL